MTTSLSTLHEGNSAMYTRTLPALLFTLDPTPFRIGPEEDVFVNLLWPRKPPLYKHYFKPMPSHLGPG